ncbi:MAG: thiol-disulfide oxidoreductase [Desulfovibrio sp.]|jgi:hypothetical protein|nr:thiol-disulfide oxidoreductase [Desulfovibrio sp.]
MTNVGLTDMCFVEVPHPLGMIPLEEVRAKAEQAFPAIYDAALHWKPQEAPKDVVEEVPYPAKRVKITGTYAELNKVFQQRKWATGMPVIPPTPDAVAAMLKGTKRSPSEVLWSVPPRMGQLTVELVAAYGVMAGCKPEHMPLLLTVIEAFKSPQVDFQGSTTTTAPAVPVILISGPILDKLGIGYSSGEQGSFQPVNASVGYFINLISDIIGGSRPPDIDKSTHGMPSDFVAAVFGENAKENPWRQTYAEEQGFKPTDNVVTVFFSYPGNANVDHNSTTGDALLETLGSGIVGAASGIGACYAEYGKEKSDRYNQITFAFMMLCPEHAATIQKTYPNKEDAKAYLQKHAVKPYKQYTAGPLGCEPPAEIKDFNADTLMPRFMNPESFRIVVTGGAGKQSQLYLPFATNVKPVSVKVEE